jgi:hypothetical protein
MAEWLKRSTVNTFYRGSNPLKAFMFNSFLISLAKPSGKKINFIKHYLLIISV